MGDASNLDSCLTLSSCLMTPKLDCQKLKGCLSDYFIVDISLSAQIMCQNYIKVEHLELEINVTATKICVQGTICKERHLVMYHLRS